MCLSVLNVFWSSFYVPSKTWTKQEHPVYGQLCIEISQKILVEFVFTEVETISFLVSFKNWKMDFEEVVDMIYKSLVLRVSKGRIVSPSFFVCQCAMRHCLKHHVRKCAGLADNFQKNALLLRPSSYIWSILVSSKQLTMEWMGSVEVLVFVITAVHCYYFIPLVSFYTPWKHEKTRYFLCFQGV